MIKVNKITKSFKDNVVLSDISFGIYEGQKIALVGPNGIGKSVLLKIIAGIEEMDSGSIDNKSGVRIAYLPQELSSEQGLTVDEYFQKISRGRESAPEYQIEMILQGLDLNKKILTMEIKNLSGGEKSKVALCGLLIQDADVLLLDEPTNNLDISSLIWLEGFIRNSPAAFLIVSHDRTFLDKTTSKVIEIDWRTRGAIERNGSYSDYLEQKRQEFDALRARYLEQKEEITRLEGSVRDSKDWAQKGAHQKRKDNNTMIRGRQRDRSAGVARRAMAIEKKIEQMDKIERPMERPPMEMDLDPIPNQAKQSIRFDDVVLKLNPDLTLGPITLEIPYGERVAILGKNGAGKTTLLKLITGEQKPDRGEIYIGGSLIFGNLMQSHENLPLEKTAAEFMIETGNIKREKMYHLLSKFGFEEREANKKISEFSPGGRTRLVLALFSAISANVLILDEPTNHLDIDAMTELEEALSTYSGTIIIVSHDRYFLNHMQIDRFFTLSNGKLSTVQSYEDYISKLE